MASGTIIIRAVKKPHNRNEIILKNFMPHQQNKKSDTMTEVLNRLHVISAVFNLEKI